MSFHTGQSFTFGETPSATKWNYLWENDYALADGTGLEDDFLITRHLAAAGSLDIPLPNVDLGSSVDGGYIATSETTTSTSFTDLATAGPSCTITVPASGKVLLLMTIQVSNSGAGYSLAAYSMSGANTAAEDSDRVIQVTGSNAAVSTRASLLTGLTAGSTTFKLRYRVQSGTGTYLRRSIIAIPIP